MTTTRPIKLLFPLSLATSYFNNFIFAVLSYILGFDVPTSSFISIFIILLSFIQKNYISMCVAIYQAMNDCKSKLKYMQ